MAWLKRALVPEVTYEKYEFVPREGITAYELAEIFKRVSGLGTHQFVHFAVGAYEKAPPGVKRHFRKAA